MKITFYNEYYPNQVYPFPNLMLIETDRWRFGIGILGMNSNSWEEAIMYRMEVFSYTQFRFLIFAIAWESK